MDLLSTVGEVTDEGDTDGDVENQVRNWLEQQPPQEQQHQQQQPILHQAMAQASRLCPAQTSGGGQVPGQSQMAHQPQLGQNRTSFFQHEPIPQFFNYNQAQASGGGGEKQIQQQQMAPGKQTNQDRSRIPGPRPQQHAQNNTFFENNGQFRLPVMTLQPPKLREAATTEEFILFLTDFEEMINRDNIHPNYRLKYLVQAVQDNQVRLRIQAFPSDDQGLQSAIRTLKIKYGDEERLKIEKMNEVQQFGDDTKTADGLFKLSALINSILSNNAFNAEWHRGSILFQKIIGKLSIDIQDRYTENTLTQQQNLQSLGEFLEIVAENKFEQEKRRKSHGQTSGYQKIKHFSSEVNKGPCNICQQPHHTYYCLKEKSAVEAEELCKERGLCFNCFSKYHDAKDCKKPFNCKICFKKHNTILHHDE